MNLRSFAPVAVALLLTSICPSSNAANVGEDWHTDFRAAAAQAKREGKPLLVDFSTGWCPNCRKLEGTMEDPAVTSRLDNFVKVYVDGDQHADMVQNFNIDGFPTLVAISPNGSEIDRSVGYVSARSLSGTLDDIIRKSPVRPPKPETKVAAAVAKPAKAEKNISAAEIPPVAATIPTKKLVASASASVPSSPFPSGESRPAAKPMNRADINFYTLTESSKGGGSESRMELTDNSQPVTVKTMANDRSVQSVYAETNRAPITQDVVRSAVVERKPIVVAQAETGSRPVAESQPVSGADELPKPMINVGETRDSGAGLPAPAATAAATKSADSEVKVEVKAADKTASAKVAPKAQEVASANPPRSPMDTIRKLQAAPSPTAAKAATASADKPAASAKSGADTKASTTKSDSKATAKSDAKSTLPKADEKVVASRPAPDAAVVAPKPDAVKGRGTASAEDVASWMKTGDDMLKNGRKKEAAAMYRRIYETDVDNVHGKSDIAYIKWCALIVDRDDDQLRKSAYDSICQFIARYPNSEHKDHYTVIRAMLAVDLGKTDEAHSLLDDFLTRFPDSRFKDMAHKLWQDLPAATKPKAQTAKAR
ncbi:MAG: thioredoxin fold domain-containing protein [Candidatus Sumerlaeaceae bacterium]|nr:thioredoxin fold domain-containing protein [Candidatus Sumerlaeaceae bacterium]